MGKKRKVQFEWTLIVLDQNSGQEYSATVVAPSALDAVAKAETAFGPFYSARIVKAVEVFAL